MLIKACLIAAVALLLPMTEVAHAEPVAKCNKPDIVFVNGVWNDTPADVELSVTQLRKALSEEVALDSSSYTISPFFNPGDGWLIDVLEVFLAQRSSGGHYLTALAAANAAFSEKLKSVDSNFNVYIEELRLQVLAKLARGPVVLIGHSQGNILVNRVARRIFHDDPASTRRLAVTGVAVADDSSAGNFYRYVTDDQDVIIGLLPGALARNWTGALNTFQTDITSHKFVDTYLSNWRGALSRQTLRNVVATLTQESFDLVRCINTQLQIIRPTSPDVPLARPFVLEVRVIPTDNPVGFGRVPVGSISFVDSTGATLCTADISNPGAQATCSITFSGLPRNIILDAIYSGTNGYVDSKSSIAISLNSAYELFSRKIDLYINTPSDFASIPAWQAAGADFKNDYISLVGSVPAQRASADQRYEIIYCFAHRLRSGLDQDHKLVADTCDRNGVGNDAATAKKELLDILFPA